MSSDKKKKVSCFVLYFIFYLFYFESNHFLNSSSTHSVIAQPNKTTKIKPVPSPCTLVYNFAQEYLIYHLLT